MKFKQWFKVIAVVMSLIMFIESVPPESLSAVIYAAESGVDTNDDALIVPTVDDTDASPSVISEIESMRTDTTATYLMSDGTYSVAQYAEPVFYNNGNGKYGEIDNTLLDSLDTEDGNAQILENKSNPLNVKFAKKLKSNNLVKIKLGNYQISWGLDGKNKDFSDAEAVVEAVNQPTGISENEAKMLRKKANSSITYKNIKPDVDLNYVLSANSLKENIIINKSQDDYTYIFTLKTNNLEAEKTENGEIRFFDSSDPKTDVFTIPAPYMYDAAGNLSNDVAFSLEGSKKKYTLTLTADKEWINDANRQFPVVIDPEISSQQKMSNLTTRVVMSKNQYATTGTAYVGNQISDMGVCRSYFKVNSLPALKSGDVVISANFSAYQWLSTASPSGFSTIDAANRLRVHAYEVLGNWSSSTTWSNQPACNDIIADYNYATRNGGATVTWDITKIVKKWYDTNTNYGIVIKSYKESQKTLVAFNSAYGTGVSASTIPVIVINYQNSKGTEEYWSYLDYEVNGVGTAHVNYYTGSLNFEMQDFAGTGNRMPASLSHIYNSQDVGKNTPQTPYTGLGWRLSAQKNIKAIASTDPLYTAGYRYIYTDEDGTEHYFDESNQDEDGLGLTLTVNSSSSPKYIIKDAEGNQSEYVASGLLIFDRDTNGNYITYHYSGARLIKITDGAGRAYNITATSDGPYMLTVSDSAGRTTSFGYSGIKLARITRPDNTVVTCSYDSSTRLTKVTNPDGEYVSFAYDSLGRVSKVAEGGGSSEGQSVTITYPMVNTTVIEDNLGNKLTYKFDNSGRLVCVYDDDGNSEASGYSNSGKSKNKLTQSGIANKTIVNLLKDSSFENQNAWEPYGTVSGTYTASIDTSPENAYIGNNSVKLVSNGVSADPVGYRLTNVSLPAGTYTFSAYVKTQNVVPGRSTGSGTLLYVVEDGQPIRTCPTLYTGTTDTSIDNGWRRLSLTFTTDKTSTFQFRLSLCKATGTVWYDCAQLETGDCANEYNLVQDSSFELSSSDSLYSWIPLNTESGDCITSITDKKFGNNVLKLNGNTALRKGFYQKVQIGNGTENDTYILSGWTNANSVPFTNGKGVYCHMTCGIYYSDGTSKWSPVAFNPDVTGWQYASGVINCDDGDASTNKTVAYLLVYFLYYNNVNTAYFDGMQLTYQSGSTYGYDSNGNQTTEISEGKKTTDVYDANNNLISSTDEDGKVTTWTYDSQNRETSMTESDGTKWTYEYDSYGNCFRTTQKNSAGTVKSVSTTTYDQYHNVLSESYTEDGTTTTTSATFSSNGNYPASETDADGNTTYTNYDANTGMLLSETDANNITTTYTYDVMDRQTSVSVPNGSQTITTQYGYTPGGRQSSITRNGFTYTFTYDSFGNESATKIGNRTLASNTYAGNNGELTRTTYGNGAYVESTFNENTKVSSTKWNGTTTATYVYDGDGNLVQAVDNVRGVTYNYDIRYDGALVIETGTDGTEFTYDYRDTNNLNSAKYTIGVESRNISYQYDGNGNNTGVTLPNNASVANVYNGDGAITSSKVTTTGGTELQTSYTYTANKENIASIANPADGTLTYTYDGNGNILTVSQNNVQKLKYTYDSLNQLVREDNAYSNQSYTYAYDVGGNITSKKTYAYTTGTLGSATSTVNYSYGDSSWKDLLTSYDGNTINYDEIGNPLSYNGWTFTWQRGRQLAYATKGSDSVSYVYNDSGIRTSKTVNGTTTNYFLDSTNKVIGEQNINNTIWYYYDSNDKLIGFELNGTPYYYTRNAQGDITAVVNSAGNVVAKYSYDAWGNIISMTDGDGTDISNNTTHVGYLNPYRYRGYRYDAETGFYYLQSRYYNPQVGRFINADNFLILGISRTSISNNLFAYCENNSVNKIDPDGLLAASLVLQPSLIQQLSVALAMIMRGISVSINSIRIAIATSWSTILAISAVTVAIVGIVKVVNRVRTLYYAAQRTITAVKANLKKNGVTYKVGTHTVYVIYPNGSNYDVCYVGRTNNYPRRQKEHQHYKKKGESKSRFPIEEFTMVAVATGLTLAQSRALEQTLITAYSTVTLKNLMNSISPKKWKYFKSEFKQMRNLIDSWIDPQ